MASTVLARHVHHIDPIKGSRFRGTVIPVVDLAAAEKEIAGFWDREPDATHHCWALRLRDGTVYAQDDGEPSGTAGRPILARLEGQDLVDVLLVVSRWYGGTNLGTGGLVRAYGACATATLEGAEIAEWILEARVVVTHGYGDTGVVDGAFNAADVTPEQTDYGTEVRHVVRLPAADAPALVHAITEATSGRARVEVDP